MKMRDDTQAARFGTGFALLFLIILALNAVASTGRPAKACCTATAMTATAQVVAPLSSPDSSTTRHTPGWE